MVSFALVVIKFTVQVIWEKEYPQYAKHNKEFNDDYKP